MNYWPNGYGNGQSVNLSSGTYYLLSETDKQHIRAIVADELKKALHPEQQTEAADVEYTNADGEKWRGKVYRVEDEEEE